MSKKLFKKSGFTLVETLVAISIFTMSILGLLSVLASGISDTGYAKKKMQAEYLAQEGIEYARNQRDTSILYSSNPGSAWSTFNTPGSIYYPISDPEFNEFTRTVSKQPIDANEIKILSTVSWEQGSGSHHVTFSEDLFNWIE